MKNMRFAFMVTLLVVLTIGIASLNTVSAIPTMQSCFSINFCDCDVPVPFNPPQACYDQNGRTWELALCGTIGPPNLCQTGVHLPCP